MAERFVLCRRDLSDFGEPMRYCAKPITKANDSDFCEDHRKNFPLWPANDPAVQLQEVA